MASAAATEGGLNGFRLQQRGEMMLAPNENKPNLYLEYVRRAEENINHMVERSEPYAAEIAPGRQGQWHVVTVVPCHENIAAGHLTARRFGIFLPERTSVEMRRGRKVDITRLLLPGYLFVYAWDVDNQKERIRACPGVLDFVHYSGGGIAVVPWPLINHLRAIENSERPMTMTVEVIASPKKKRQRQSRKPMITSKEVPVDPDEIVGIHAYSPFLEEIRKASTPEARVSAFHKAMGLAP